VKKNEPIKLTEKEKLRAEKTAATAAALEADGFRKTELTISLKKAMLMAIVLWLIYSTLSSVLFSLRYSVSQRLSLRDYIIMLPIILVLIVVHELVHGITWRFLVQDKKSIEFGFTPQRMTPYCTCSEPLSRSKYVLGGIMPFLVLGVLLTVIAIFTGSKFLLTLASLNVFGAGGDLTVLIKLFLYKSSAKEMVILDHPTDCGCLIFER